MGSMLLGQRDSIRRCLAEEEGERTVTDLRHGLELLNREEAEHGLGIGAVDLRELEGLVVVPIPLVRASKIERVV